MANGPVNSITMSGNLTRAPELRFTQSGAPVVNMDIAHTPRVFDQASSEWKDGDTTFMRVTAWRQLAENVAESLTIGASVLVTGKLKSRTVEKDGSKTTYFEIEADKIAADLQYVTAVLTKHNGGNQQGAPAQQQNGGNQQNAPAQQQNGGNQQNAPAQQQNGGNQQNNQQGAPAQQQSAPVNSMSNGF